MAAASHARASACGARAYTCERRERRHAGRRRPFLRARAHVGVPRGSGTCSPFLHETHKTHRLDKREANVRRAVLMVGRGEQ